MPDDAPRLSTEYGQTLLKLGLTDKALRTEENGRMSAQRDGNDDKWWIHVPWDSNMRTSRGYAERQARERLAKFSRLRELIGETFGTMAVTLPLSLDPTRGTEKHSIFMIRGMIKLHIRNSVYQIGTRGDYISLKVISVDPLAGELMTLFESLLPRSARLEWSNRPAAEFDSCLRRLVAPDLPSHDNDRARLEYVLTSIRQVSLFGTAYALIYKSNISSDKLAHNSLKIKERPRNPLTDAIATCYGPPRAKKIPFADERWRQYLDHHETNGTTPEQYAAMQAELEPHAPHPPGDNRQDRQPHEADGPAEM